MPAASRTPPRVRRGASARAAAGLLLLGAGVAAHLQAREDDARRFLLDALKVDPALTPASLLLGTVLYQAGDIDGAIDTYQQALEHDPNHPQIVKRLEAWRKEAALHSGFGRSSATTSPCSSKAPPRRSSRIARWRFSRPITGGSARRSPPIQPTSSRSCSTRASSSATSRNRPDGPAVRSTAGFGCPCRARCRISPSSTRVLAHEFTHALVRSLAPRGVPYLAPRGFGGLFRRQ